MSCFITPLFGFQVATETIVFSIFVITLARTRVMTREGVNKLNHSKVEPESERTRKMHLFNSARINRRFHTQILLYHCYSMSAS